MPRYKRPGALENARTRKAMSSISLEDNTVSTLPKDLNENLLGTLSIEASMQPSTTTTTTGPNDVHKPNVAKPLVDANCMREWTELGYTPSQISWMGWCQLS